MKSSSTLFAGLPTPPFFPTLYPFIPTPLLPLLVSFHSPPSVICYLCFYSYPILHFHFPSHIPFLPFLSFHPLLPFLPHLSILLLFLPPSIHRPPSLSSIFFLPTSSLPLSFSLLAPSLFLSPN